MSLPNKDNLVHLGMPPALATELEAEVPGLSGTNAFTGANTFPAGTGAGTVAPAGRLTVNLTSTGNGADTTEDALMTYALPANSLSAVGKGLKIRAWGSCAANADNKTMRLYFGSEVITTPTAATNAKNWWLELEVYKTGASTQRVVGRGCVDTTAVTVLDTTGSETDTAAITIKVTGQAGTGNANDIIADVMIVEMLN